MANKAEILNIEKITRILVFSFLSLSIFLLNPLMVQARLQISESEDGIAFTRSLESLRDLDYQTWQVVAYPKTIGGEDFVLRIVGYPGTLRMDHPAPLEVHSGLKNWHLEDLTLSNPQLANDPREAAAEFDLTLLLNDLTNNRPLRLSLTEVFSDLPVPPFVVSEWRSLSQKASIDETD